MFEPKLLGLLSSLEFVVAFFEQHLLVQLLLLADLLVFLLFILLLFSFNSKCFLLPYLFFSVELSLFFVFAFDFVKFHFVANHLFDFFSLFLLKLFDGFQFFLNQ